MSQTVLYQKEIIVTAEDIEILNALCEGKTFKEIAVDRNTIERRVTARLDYLRRKYACYNIVELVATFFRNGLLK